MQCVLHGMSFLGRPRVDRFAVPRRSHPEMASDFSFISVAWPWSAKIAVAFVQLDGPFYEEKRKGVTPDGRQTLVWDSVAAERRIARACDILDLIAHSARRPELVVFPEYSLPLTEEGIARLQAKAREHGQVIAAGADNLTDGAYAECLIFGANATAHKVRKHGPSQWEQTMERADASAPIPVFTWTHQGK